MLSIQHILAYRAYKSDTDTELRAGDLIIPDALRAWTGPRAYTHFEQASIGTDVSSFKFPVDIKNSTAQHIMATRDMTGHLARQKPAAIGEKTVLSEFQRTNGHLKQANPQAYAGIEMHLVQDRAFDKLIRERINCSGKYDDVYRYTDPKTDETKTYDGKGIRNVIAGFEQYGIYALAKTMYEREKVTCDSDYIRDVIAPEIRDQYPADLAEKTLSFMTIDPEIDGYIRNHDFSHLNDGPMTETEWDEFYSNIIDKQPEAEFAYHYTPTVEIQTEDSMEMDL